MKRSPLVSICFVAAVGAMAAARRPHVDRLPAASLQIASYVLVLPLALAVGQLVFAVFTRFHGTTARLASRGIGKWGGERLCITYSAIQRATLREHPRLDHVSVCDLHMTDGAIHALYASHDEMANSIVPTLRHAGVVVTEDMSRIMDPVFRTTG